MSNKRKLWLPTFGSYAKQTMKGKALKTLVDPIKEPKMATKTLKDLADKVGVSVRTVYRAVQAGNIQIIRYGRNTRISDTEFNRILVEGFESAPYDGK